MYNYTKIDSVFGSPLNEILINENSSKNGLTPIQIILTISLITIVGVIVYSQIKEDEKSVSKLF